MADLIQINNGLISIGGNLIEITSSGPSLPPYTIRLKFTEGVTPTFDNGIATQVSASPNIWDLTYEDAHWGQLIRDQVSLLEVLGGNTSGVTSMRHMFLSCTSLTKIALFDTSSLVDMSGMFYGCTNLTSVPVFNTSSVEETSSTFMNCTCLTKAPLFDTSSVTDMSLMFLGCSSLTAVPLYDTSSATNMEMMFYNCPNVQSGALALYQQVSSQTTPPSKHGNMFFKCGENTVTGSAELAQIPVGWGGTKT